MDNLNIHNTIWQQHLNYRIGVDMPKGCKTQILTLKNVYLLQKTLGFWVVWLVKHG
jgi:hypothetical protein